VIFENFLKFSKRRRAVPLRPIWTIMITAELDQSRVLVIKFRQNRLTLKGRSAGQRHTHRQTGRQTDRQTRLKIMALCVCNRANNCRGIYWDTLSICLMKRLVCFFCDRLITLSRLQAVGSKLRTRTTTRSFAVRHCR